MINAQYFGGFPADIKWFQIETPYTSVVFPEGLSSKANRVASNIDFLVSKQDSIRDFKLRKINIVLNNQGVQSNGYVSSSPYHSMFFLTPSQNANVFGVEDWLDGLTTHEYRHVWQYNQMRSKWCNLLYFFTGDRGWGAYTHMIFPSWYFEGDAVLSETKFSNSGRGRVPYFSLTERAMALDSVRYKYIKIRNGSYKNALPNYYQYGYNLLAYGNKKFGEEGWRRVVKRASNLKGLFYLFSNAIKKETGHGARVFYDSMMVDFSQHTHQKAAMREITPSTKISKTSKTVSNYYQSVFETDSTLLVMKNSYKELLSFYRINLHTGEEKKLYDVGYLDNPWFTYANGELAWAETRHDVRRWNKGYSIIRKLKLGTHSVQYLTKNTNYFSPAFSADGRKMAVVEYTPDLQCAVKIIHPVTGSLMHQVVLNEPFDRDILAITPIFSEDGTSLYFMLKKSDRLAFFQYDLANSKLTQLAYSTTNTISNPIVKGNRIYYSASYGGQDDIFYLDKTDAKIYRVTSSRVGAFYPAISPRGDKLVFSNYTLNGYDLQQIDMPEKGVLIDVVEPRDESYYAASIFKNDSIDITRSVSTKNYEVKKYKRMGHALNFHSWGPIANGDLINEEFNTGVEVYSNNILNNTSILAGMYYNYNNEFAYARAGAYYGGLFPVLFLNYTQIFDSKYDIQLIERGGILPFDFSTAVYGKSLLLQLGYLTQNYSYEGISVDFKGLHFAVNFNDYKYPAKQQVAPRKGLAFLFDWKSGSLNNIAPISESTFKSTFYLPGFFKTHAIKLQASQKWQTPDYDGYFMDEMGYARAYQRPDSAYALYNKLGFNYHLPLCYPEIGVNSIFYLKRIRMNLFSDFGFATLGHYDGQSFKQNYSSAGVELYFDIKWFNNFDIPFFVRYSYCFNQDVKTTPFEFGTPVITF